MTPWPTLAARRHGLAVDEFLARYKAAVDPAPATVVITTADLDRLVATAKGQLVEHWPVRA